jgi:hypothetical protein
LKHKPKYLQIHFEYKKISKVIEFIKKKHFNRCSKNGKSLSNRNCYPKKNAKNIFDVFETIFEVRIKEV